VCTGNWGCGAFGGDVQLKAVLQLLAASQTGRPAVRYLTFGDKAFAEQLNALGRDLRARGVTVGRLAALLREFAPAAWPPRPDAPAGNVADLFGFLSARCAPTADPATAAAAGEAMAAAAAEHDSQTDVDDDDKTDVDEED
jgi:hypothetical protein